MSVNTDPNNAAARQSGLLKKSWWAFNRWRRRWFKWRVLFLLMFLAYVSREAFCPIVARLVRASLVHVDLGSEPPVVTALARHRRARMAYQVQQSFRAAADKDGDGRLGETELAKIRDFGLDPEQLERRSVDADLSRLIAASHRAGLLPRSFTAREARRDAWFASVAEFEQLKRPYRTEMEAMLKVWEMPDYGKWTTWDHGLRLFVEWIQHPVEMLGRPRTVLLWLFFCFFLALMVTSRIEKRLAIGLLIGGVLAVTVAALTAFDPAFRHIGDLSLYDKFLSTLYRVVPGIGFVFLSMAATGYAGRMTSGRRAWRFYFCIGALGLSIVLLACGLPRWISGDAFSPLSREDEFLWTTEKADWLLRRSVPEWVKDVAVLAGVVSLATGLSVLARSKRPKRQLGGIET